MRYIVFIALFFSSLLAEEFTPVPAETTFSETDILEEDSDLSTHYLSNIEGNSQEEIVRVFENQENFFQSGGEKCARIHP